MDKHILRFCSDPYTIPHQLLPGIHTPGAQIVAAWFIIQTQSRHTYKSLQSCRLGIAPSCNWDEIGKCLQKLLNVKTAPPSLLPMHVIGEGNTTVVIGHFGAASLTAIKQHVFSRGSWEVSSHVLSELLALEALQSHVWSPSIVFHSITQDMVQIGMEYIPLSMKQMVRFGNRNLTFGRRLAVQLLESVKSLHELRMAHRDIKPDNIRFRSNGDLVLIDYDSCVRLDKNIQKTRRVCTAAYRDPFLFREHADLDTYDYRSLDAYSVGAVILFIFNGGRNAFTGSSEEEIGRSMIAYSTGKTFESLCVRAKLPKQDIRVLRGLLAMEPDDRMIITEAYASFQSRE